MSLNIRAMLKEASSESNYQLIVTDDDYLESGVLSDIVSFLHQQMTQTNPAPVIWTPRFSYTEDDKLYCVVCDKLRSSSPIHSSAINTGRYMENGFVLSGLILDSKLIDFEFWSEYAENAFFPVIFVGDLLRTHGAYYWNYSIVHHTVLNECHWERWGKSDIAVELRLLSDFVNAYDIMAIRIGDIFPRLLFYGASIPSMYRRVLDMLISEKLQGDRKTVLETVREMQAKRLIRFSWSIRLQMMLALGANVLTACSKVLYCTLAVLVPKNESRESHHRRIGVNLRALQTIPVVFRIIAT
jgi:hypothetical protein